MMKTLIIVCLCTFLLVDACDRGNGQGGGQQGGGQQGGGQVGQSIIERAKRQEAQNPLASLIQGMASLGSMALQALPDLSTMMTMLSEFLNKLGLPDIQTLITKAQQVFANMQIPGIPDFAALIAKITQFFMQLLGSIRSRREIKWYPELIIN